MRKGIFHCCLENEYIHFQKKNIIYSSIVAIHHIYTQIFSTKREILFLSTKKITLDLYNQLHIFDYLR